MAFFPVDRDRPRRCAEHALGETIHASAAPAMPWRVVNGIVRLDAPGSDGRPTFASLAIAGDILACETLLFGITTFRATALTACRLAPWPEGAGIPSGESLLTSLAQSQQRAADLIALRGGQAIDRVLGLVRLLADNAGNVVLPSRQDMADITDLRLETISRLLGVLVRERQLETVRLNGIHATRSLRLLPSH